MIVSIRMRPVRCLHIAHSTERTLCAIPPRIHNTHTRSRDRGWLVARAAISTQRRRFTHRLVWCLGCASPQNGRPLRRVLARARLGSWASPFCRHHRTLGKEAVAPHRVDRHIYIRPICSCPTCRRLRARRAIAACACPTLRGSVACGAHSSRVIGEEWAGGGFGAPVSPPLSSCGW